MTAINDFIGTWGRYDDWMTLETIHPEDKEQFSQLSQRGDKVYYCSAVTLEGYLVLESGITHIRVKPSGYHTIPSPPYKLGEVVIIKERPNEKAQIRDIKWHWEHNKEIYLLRIGERKSSRWYWREDIEHVNQR